MDRPLWIENGRVVDPATGEDARRTLGIRNGVIANTAGEPPPDAEVIDATGLVVSPGFWDVHVHLREPGGEAAETIASGSEAAARGGFTTIVAMPNTTPTIDTPELVEFVLRAGREAGHARVWTTSAITRGRQGRELAPLAECAEAGAIAFTDDGGTVPSTGLMRDAMVEARALDRVIMDHAQDPVLEQQGVMHEGDVSRRLNLPGIPSRAETEIVQRDADLSRETGCAVHIQHVTAGDSIPIIAAAKQMGTRITAELTPHHLALADEDIGSDDANFKMNPPLRTAGDRDALRQGLLDGVLDFLATDHAPHPAERKAEGFLTAPFGILGLETAVGVTHGALVSSGALSLAAWIGRWTAGPARLLGRPPPSLAPGSRADVTLLDLRTSWTVNPADSASKSRNTPFGGRTLTGRAVRTILAGRTTWQA